MERLAAVSPRLLVRLDALLSRASLSRRMGLYLIATSTACAAPADPGALFGFRTRASLG
jgi:hypothetical protein